MNRFSLLPRARAFRTSAALLVLATLSLSGRATTFGIVQRWNHQNSTLNRYYVTGAEVDVPSNFGTGTEDHLLRRMWFIEYVDDVPQHYLLAKYPVPPSFSNDHSMFARFTDGVFHHLGNVSTGGSSRTPLVTSAGGGSSWSVTVGTSRITRWSSSGGTRYNLVSSEKTVLVRPSIPGPIGHWPLDETTGETAADVINGNDGLWQNAGGTNLSWVPGQIGGAAQLSDLGGDSFFRIDSISQLLGASALTVTAWIDPDPNPDYDGIFTSRSVDGGTNSWGLHFENNASGSNHLDTRIDGSATDSPPDSLPADGGWFHVAVVWDGEAGTHTQYINGVQSGTAAAGVPTGDISGTSGPWFIGYDDSGADTRDFDGRIDDVGMWNVALSANQVAGVYQNGLQGVQVGDTPRDLRLDVEVAGDDLVFTWGSQAGKLYNLRSTLDPASAAPINWPIWDSRSGIVPTPFRNTLTIPRPGERVRFFVIEEFDAP